MPNRFCNEIESFMCSALLQRMLSHSVHCRSSDSGGNGWCALTVVVLLHRSITLAVFALLLLRNLDHLCSG